jgi:hypothetical protein
MNLNAYTNIYPYKYIFIFIFISYIYICINTYAYKFSNTYISVYINVYTYIFIHIFIKIHIYTYIYTCIHTYLYVHKYRYSHTHIYIWTKHIRLSNMENIHRHHHQVKYKKLTERRSLREKVCIWLFVNIHTHIYTCIFISLQPCHILMCLRICISCIQACINIC